MVLVKGAVERVLELCGGQMDADGARPPLDRDAVLRAADELADRGLRVLATAVRLGRRGAGARRGRRCTGSLALTGLQAMLDPPRAAAAAAVAACHPPASR